MTSNVLLFDAPAGAGKTRALTRHSHRLAEAGYKVLFIQPTKKLIDKTILEELEPLKPPYAYTAIHGGLTGSVVRTLTDHLFEVELGAGEIVFATHAAFFRLPWFPHQLWHLIVDEVPTVDVYEEHRLANTHELLKRFLKVHPYDETYGLLLPAEVA